MKYSWLSLIIPLVFYFENSSSVIVSTSLGKLSGKQVGEYHLFKQIPFAEPPIGELRFQKPENPKEWKGVRDATEYGPACMSNSTETTSIQKWIDEDCLHLNIFTSSKCLKSKDCAVVVYLHGGLLVYDSAVMFNDTHLLDSFVKNDMILAIPAFRLGIFSHFTVEDQKIAPSNLALHDILKSLEFLKTEIHNFGGSNQRVSLLGHSFGGTVAAMFAFSPNINQDLSLFQKSVVMSASHVFQSLDSNIEKTRYFAEHANCSIPSTRRKKDDRFMMECLQNKSASELLRIQRSLEESGYDVYGGVVQREPLFPEVKSSEFMKYPKNIPMLTGCTKYEFDHVTDERPVAEGFGFENPDECEEKYRRDVKDGVFDRDNHTDRTQSIFVSTKLRVDQLSRKGIPAHLYQLRYSKHIRHTDDLYYLIGVHPFEMDENEVHLKDVYQNMIMNFVKSENPGDGFETSNVENSSFYEINWNERSGVRPKMSTGFEKKVMDYWGQKMTEFDRKVTLQKEKKFEKTFRSAEIQVDSLPSKDQNSRVFVVISVLFLVFLLGYFLGKHASQRNAYIRLDGEDYETMKNF